VRARRGPCADLGVRAESRYETAVGSVAEAGLPTIDLATRDRLHYRDVRLLLHADVDSELTGARLPSNKLNEEVG
jgi:hypothetical protein